jgi:hypothetical protein
MSYTSGRKAAPRPERTRSLVSASCLVRSGLNTWDIAHIPVMLAMPDLTSGWPIRTSGVPTRRSASGYPVDRSEDQAVKGADLGVQLLERVDPLLGLATPPGPGRG